jgi:hypothetical protein
MPCNGIAVMTAEVAVDLEEHLQDELSRQTLATWLREQNVDVKKWWKSTGTSWALGIGSEWCGLRFAGSTVEASNEDDREYRRHKAEVERAYALAHVFAGQLAQQQIVTACVALDLAPQDLEHRDGVLTFRINAGVPTKVRVDPTGQVELITEEGDFAFGQTALEALLGAIQAQGVDAQPTGQVETHRHDLMITTTGQYSANVAVNPMVGHQMVSESGPPHTH